MEVGIKDEKSGRQIIEGRGIPVDGGVFRREGHPGIVVDSSKLEDLQSFKDSKEVMLSIHSGLLDMATYLAERYVPVNNLFYKNVFIPSFGKQDRYSLGAFVLKDNVDYQMRGTADSQALFAALLLETRLNKEKDTNRKVGIVKDPTDGHARVIYQGKHGDIYKFDPSIGDKKFVKLEGQTII